jgi:glucose/arabinose dehydrogenase
MRLFILLASVFIASHLAPAQAAQYKLEIVADNLNQPWSIAFLPNGSYLLSLLSGELRIVSNAGNVGQPIANTPASYVKSQGGYFDVALDPNYPQNQLIYLAFAYGEPASNATRVIKAKLVDNSLENVTPIFTLEPRKDTSVHYGGKLQFSNDGTLIITTGDGFQYREAAQDKFSQLGKIIRINSDGSVPADNPFASGKEGDPKVYAYGVRNPQGLAYDAVNNILYQHEHGPKGGDEVNIIAAANNYGWPAATYGVNYSGAKVSPYTQLPGVTDPIKYWVPSIAPSGMTLYTGKAFPAWQGDLFVGALVDKEVRRLDLQDGKIIAEESLFGEIDARIRDIQTGPDGMLYILTDSNKGKLIRVRPEKNNR